MDADRPKSSRTLVIADHLWEAFARMAREMGSDRDALANQALYAFAREHGFALADAEASTPASVARIEQRLTANGLSRRFSTPPRHLAEASATEHDLAAVCAEGAVLVLLAEGREIERVEKERFVIGRGKHCDLVLSSAKVSREHAAIVREGEAWFIEDLGSSNGTWFGERRIERRRIEDGDEYSICSEKLSCAFR